ncbi:hypothetical protein EUX98_g6292 [Antrodiella citrinella]|uniref:Uncharacterized protein n=1 Tax=Antrodiella citrinella TaxID=2447956 RepID=A0A4S4MWW0_9APHY|nr:hypothetical protein EUX98_g6292 [Antrodiella citrinella]
MPTDSSPICPPSLSQHHEAEQSDALGPTLPVWQSVFLCGALCTVGALGISRYSRCRTKRFYGRLGLGAVFAAWTYDAVVDDDTQRRFQRQMEDPNLQKLWHTAQAAALVLANARDGTILKGKTRGVLTEFYEKRSTDEEKQLKREEGFSTVCLDPDNRATAHLFMNAQWAAAGVSLRDKHRATIIMASCADLELLQDAGGGCLAYGIVSALVGVVSPCWPILIRSLFFTSMLGLSGRLWFVTWRNRTIVRNFDAIEDRQRVGDACDVSWKEDETVDFYLDPEALKDPEIKAQINTMLENA